MWGGSWRGRCCRIASGLFVPELLWQVSRDFHRVVQNSTNLDKIMPIDAVQNQMSWSRNGALYRSGVLLAVAKMVGAHVVPEFGPAGAASAIGIGGNVAQTGNEECLVARPRDGAEFFLGIGENSQNVRFG